VLLFNQSFLSPAENLACDEALLDLCDATDSPGYLRFWESVRYFVVLGYAKRLADEVFSEVCARLSIPILRRCTGGGTVLQGRGCFNYTLVLPFAAAPELGTITGANCFIMRRNRDAVHDALDSPVEIRGYTDLTVGDLKFSGNAQRRKKRSLLFHGSFLLDFDLSLIERTLRMPADQPEYRSKRPHTDFLTNVSASRSNIERELLKVWAVENEISQGERDEIMHSTKSLALTKYGSEAWNRRF
jgi:lipoate-protein ligase A